MKLFGLFARRETEEPEPEPEVERACGNCKFKRTGHRMLKKAMVECHKSSPYPGQGESYRDQWRAIWPAVKTSEDCGEHKLRGEGE